MNHHHRSTQVCTCSQGISQFYLHTHTFIRNRNEPYLPLPSQPQLVLIYRPRRDGLRLSRPRCEVGYFLTTKPMLGRSLFLLKSRFLSLVLPNLNRSGFFFHAILLYGIDGRLRLRSARGRLLQVKPKRLCFCNTCNASHHSSFLTPVPVPNSKGNPFSGGARYK